MLISQSACDLIIAEEVSSKATYIKKYQRPEWPGVQSGVTVGIGYDLGYATKAKIAADFGPYVTPGMLEVMQSCAGITKAQASNMLARVKNQILIPWEVAIKVFQERTLPQWVAQVKKACPGAEKLNSTCLGVIVSLAYNRGTGGFNSNGDRYREMREIRAAIRAGKPELIPDQLRAMARIWPSVPGLQGRRRREAALFEKGLKLGNDPVPTAEIGPVPKKVDAKVIESSIPEQPARTPAPEVIPTGATAKNTTTGGLITATVGGVTGAAFYGIPYSTIAIVATCAVIAIGVIWWKWKDNHGVEE